MQGRGDGVVIGVVIEWWETVEVVVEGWDGESRGCNRGLFVCLCRLRVYE